MSIPDQGVANNISEKAKANYCEVFDINIDCYKNNSNVIKMDNFTATDIEEDKRSTRKNSATEKCDPSD